MTIIYNYVFKENKNRVTSPQKSGNFTFHLWGDFIVRRLHRIPLIIMAGLSVNTQ